jgi:hypothetical protein
MRNSKEASAPGTQTVYLCPLYEDNNPTRSRAPVASLILEVNTFLELGHMPAPPECRHAGTGKGMCAVGIANKASILERSFCSRGSLEACRWNVSPCIVKVNLGFGCPRSKLRKGLMFR